MEKNNQSIFFIGGRDRGFLCLSELLKRKEKLVGACIMQEDPHEIEKYDERIGTFLKNKQIKYIFCNNVNKKNAKEFIKSLNPYLIVVMGWRTIIPSEILDLPKGGCVAVHESLLPFYRGFSPVNWAIINGEKESGVSLFYLDKGIDNGDIIAQEKIKIGPDDTAYDLYKKTTKASIEIFFKYLPLLKNAKAPRIKQNEKMATYTCLRTPADGLINWGNSSSSIYNLIRGLSYPYPGAYTFLGNKKLVVWEAQPVIDNRKYIGSIAGRVVEISKNEGVKILTGDGSIFIKTVQLEGENKKNAFEIINSIKMTLGLKI